MKLLTKELEAKLPRNPKGKDPMCLVHYFNPTGAGNWFGISYNPKDRIMFGYVSIFGDWNDELGDFALWELEEYKGMGGLGIERDLHWEPKPVSEVKERYTKR
ncbi:DUF2958 domain-containing protein [Polynucleobacter sp.]|uniref:DUF2958 domain-containing protein n=1 Tax=Polynucleobacter sp. TaxID=2029855 RepID=UPI003F6A1488